MRRCCCPCGVASSMRRCSQAQVRLRSSTAPLLRCEHCTGRLVGHIRCGSGRMLPLLIYPRAAAPALPAVEPRARSERPWCGDVPNNSRKVCLRRCVRAVCQRCASGAFARCWWANLRRRLLGTPSRTALQRMVTGTDCQTLHPVRREPRCCQAQDSDDRGRCLTVGDGAAGM